MHLTYALCNHGDRNIVILLNLVLIDLDLNDDKSTLEDVMIFDGSQILVEQETASKG